MKKRNLLLLTLACLSTQAYAQGDKTGSGGIGIVCKDAANRPISAKLLDIEEGSALDNLAFSLSSANQIDRALTNLSVYDAQLKVRAELKNISENINYFSHGEYRLSLPNDFSTRITPQNGCGFQAIAVYDDIENRLHIQQDIFNLLSPLEKEALILHEAVYKLARKSGVTDSQEVRRIIAQVFSLNGKRDTIQLLVYSKSGLALNLNAYPSNQITTSKARPNEVHEYILSGTSVEKKMYEKLEWGTCYGSRPETGSSVAINLGGGVHVSTWRYSSTYAYRCPVVKHVTYNEALYDFSQTVQLSLDYTLAPDMNNIDLTLLNTSNGDSSQISVVESNNDYVMLVPTITTTTIDSFQPRNSKVPFKYLQTKIVIKVVSLNFARSLAASLKVTSSADDLISLELPQNPELLRELMNAYALPIINGSCKLRGIGGRTEHVPLSDRVTLRFNDGMPVLMVNRKNINDAINDYIERTLTSGNGMKPYRSCAKKSIRVPNTIHFSPVNHAVFTPARVGFNVSSFYE